MVHSISIRRWLEPDARQRACAAALLAALCSAALPAQAQPAAQAAARAAKPDPLDPKASVPASSYRSSFTSYRPLDDGKLISWREANDTVTRVGGWRAYAREAQRPDPAPAAPLDEKAQPEKAQPMPAGHGGHKTP